MPTPLQYGQTPSTRRKKFVASLLTSAIGVFIGLCLMRYGPAIGNWYALLSLRNAALIHTSPPKAPVLTLLTTDTQTTWGTNYCHLITRDPTWQTAQFKLFAQPQSNPGSMITLFLHQRLTPAGQPRLVALNTSPMWNPDGIFLTADLRLFTAGSFLSPHLTELTVQPNPHLHISGTIPNFPGVIVSLCDIPWSSDFRVYPAQPDPADPTAFTLPYILNGRPNSFLFHLTDNNSATITTPDRQPLPLHFPTPTTRP